MVKVSIIIPAYNAASYLGRCIDCFLQQDYKGLEIIVINDGSTDSTGDIALAYQQKYEHIVVINKKNEGAIAARWDGIREATGDYVFFCDADDVVVPDTIRLLVAHIDEADVVVGNIWIERPDGKMHNIQHTNTFKHPDHGIGLYLNYLDKSITPSLCARLIRRDLLLDIAIPDTLTIGEDVVTNLLIVQANPKIKVKLIPNRIYHYIQYPDSTINTKSVERLMQRLLYVRWVIDFIKREQIDNEENHTVVSSFLLMEYYAYLRDGGEPFMDIAFFKMLTTDYWDGDSFSQMAFWHRLLLKSYKHSVTLGKIVRYVFVHMRNFFR